MSKRPYIVADAILDTLEAHKVTTMFGYPGGVLLPFYDALPNHKIKHVLTRHEQGAAFAAQGWARTTGKIGVCVATSGPGATNLVTGIADAMLDSIPILCLTGQVTLPSIGKDAFQEIDITGITLSITKHNYLVDNPKNIVGILTEAIAIATHGRPGPVLVDIPKDVMAAPHARNFKIPRIDLAPINPVMTCYNNGPEKSVTDEVIKLINKSKKPVLILGQGIKHAKAEKEINQFIKKTGIPAACTIFAKGIMKTDDPNCLGMLGMHGLYHSNMAVHNADLIINIGSRFDDRIVGRYDIFGKQAVIVHVDIDKSELNKVVKADIAIHCDARCFTEGLLKHFHLKKLEIKEWKKSIEYWREERPFSKKTAEFSVRNALDIINQETKKNITRNIVLADVGQHQMWSALISEVPEASAWLTSGGLGTMGASFPMAVGAAFANPNKNIICITGDGGFQMNIQELGTVMANNLNVKICIMNNGYLGMVRQWQDLFYNKVYSETEMHNPDFTKAAQAYNIPAYIATNDQEAVEAVHKAFKRKGPALIEFRVDREDNVLPMVPGGSKLDEMVTD